LVKIRGNKINKPGIPVGNNMQGELKKKTDITIVKKK